MTVLDVARRLQLPERAVRYRLEKGQLRGQRETDGWRIAEQDLEAFLDKTANINSDIWRRRLRISRNHN